MVARYPQVIFVKDKTRKGFGFTYLSEDDFNQTADRFLAPILKTIEAKLSEGRTQPNEARSLRLAAALSFLAQLFAGRLEAYFGTDAIRWIAAACAREVFPEGGFPAAVMIEDDDGQVGVRAADEFLGAPGYPKATIVGSRAEGGGKARFFDREEDYVAAAEAPIGTDDWLPQILYRLYERTPSVMMALPRRPSGNAEGPLGLECTPLPIDGDEPLVERTSPLKRDD